MKFTPIHITSLKPNEVFVMGSNRAGIHGAGAAKFAYEKFGAVWGEGEGLFGQSYSFPTKGYKIEQLPLSEIKFSVKNLLYTCVTHSRKTFYLTLVGCGLCGYTPQDIAPIFKEELPLPTNLILPKEFHNIIYGN